MIDDEDGKVRRNLVVFSALVCAVTFLGVQPLELIQDLLKIKEASKVVSPWKVWLIGLLLLTYLWVRYHYCVPPGELKGELGHTRPADLPKAVRTRSEVISGTVSRIRAEQEDQLLRDILFHHVRASQNVKRSGRYKSLDSSIWNAAIDSLPSNIQADRVQRVSQVCRDRDDYFGPSPDGVSGVIRINYSVEHKAAFGIGTFQGSCAVGYRKTWLLTLEIKIRAFARTVFLSRDGVTVVFPHGLAFASGLCILYQLALTL